jgi:TonB-linked SusC/RagA family outer membrane protein
MPLSRRAWSAVLSAAVCALTTPFAAAMAQQTGAIRGTISDSTSRAPVAGVQVSIAGTSHIAISDVRGEYRLADVPTGTVTVRSQRIGYLPAQRPVTVSAGETATADFVLMPAVATLSGVVVIGYGTADRATVPYSISTVSGPDIANTPVAGLDAALQGKAAGVQVIQNAGNPGNGISVRIRGPASLNAGNQPLYVVDGVPILTEDFTQLGLGGQDVTAVTGINLSEVESINILKDAAAAAIYGSRGSNGVVLITTKRGLEGRPRITFESYYGTQDAARRLDLLNAQQYVELFHESAINDDEDPEFFPGVDDTLNVDWQDAVFRRAPVSNTQLAVSGGTGRTHYYLSGSLFNQEGIVIGSGYKRASGRLNVDFDASDRLTFRTSVALAREANDRVEGDGSLNGIVTNAIGMQPMRPVRFATTGAYADRTLGLRYSNPVAMAALNPTDLTSLRAIGNVEAEYSFTDRIRLSGRAAADVISVDELQWQSPLVDRTYAASNGGVGKSGHTTANRYLLESLLTLDALDNDIHQLSMVGGASVETNRSEWNFVRGEQFPGGFNGYVGNASIITEYDGDATEHSLVSFFSRANYSLFDRYLFSASLRTDGSSRFGEENRYGVFPAVSAAWVLTNESFGATLPGVSDLKLRASYGRTGNEDIGDFESRPSATANSYNGIPGIAPSDIGSPNLRWETTQGFDAGLDLGLFAGRIGVTADYYVRKTSDLLVRRAVPATSGYSTIAGNIGNIENRGFELALETVNLESPMFGGFRWTTNLNATWNRNEVTNLYGGQEFTTGVNGRQTSLVREGQPLGVFYMQRFEGVDPATGNAIHSAAPEIVGNPYPDVFGGFTNEISVGNFDVRGFLQYSFGNDVFNMMRLFADDGAWSYDNKFADVTRRWKQPGDITDVPRMSYNGTSGARVISSRFIEDGSYIRIQDVTVGYTLPSRFASLANMSRARIYVTGSNLYTFTDYTGYNPDANSAGSGANIVAGTDFYTYPLARTFSFGINAAW